MLFGYEHYANMAAQLVTELIRAGKYGPNTNTGAPQVVQDSQTILKGLIESDKIIQPVAGQ